MTFIPESSPVIASLNGRSELDSRFGNNAILLYALEMRFGIDDIVTVGGSCITDGPGDRKCDALYIDREERTAVIAQSYASRTQQAEAPANKASDLNTAVSWVLDGNQSQMPEALRDAAEELRQAIRDGEIDHVEIWYCHNLPESTNVKTELERAVASALGLLTMRFSDQDIDVRALEVGINRLSEWYRSTQSPILVSDELEVEIDGWFEEVGEDWAAICASIPATWLTGLHDEYQDNLFSANVRGYMPSRRTADNINHNIESTARDTPGKFWAFNNGVTGLVHDYQLPEQHAPHGRLKLTGLAIINGAQTTGALSRSNSKRLDDASVLMRFVRCSDQSMVDDLIRFNNSQNPIRPSDFRSMDRHQDRLRTEFRAIPDSTYYGARRGGQEDRARRPSNLVPSDTVAQCLAAFHGDPGRAYHSLKTIWERDEVYSEYFSDFTSAAHIVFTYSLLKSIQQAKVQLAAQESLNGDIGLPEDQQNVLSFFRQRGSQFLLVSAISNCIEVFLDAPVPSSFALSFGAASPSDATKLWDPVVEAVLPFAYSLQAEELRGNLKNRTKVSEAINNFRAGVRATAKGNQFIFEEFRSHVITL